MNDWPIFSQPHSARHLQSILHALNIERQHTIVYPSQEQLFRAFSLCPYKQVKVVILGQDPYHTPYAADGLAFSTPQGMRMPPSLRNIFKELNDDLNVTRLSTDLSDWAKQGILLLNTVLSVRAHHAHSHAHLGWEAWVKEVILDLNASPSPICFVLWGKHAQHFETIITQSHHLILKSAHPSPFSAHQGFFGSKPFSRINAFCLEHDLTPIEWSDQS